MDKHLINHLKIQTKPYKLNMICSYSVLALEYQIFKEIKYKKIKSQTRMGVS